MLWDIPAQDNPLQSYPQDHVYHGPTRLRIAFANDYLSAADSALELVGVENVWHIAKQLGLRSPEPDNSNLISAISLLRHINLLEISHLMGIFSNRGVLVGQNIQNSDEDYREQGSIKTLDDSLEPTIILSVENIEGKVLLDWSQPRSKSILTPQLAYLVTNILSDQTARWPSLGHPNPLEIGRPAAVKHSSDTDGQSNWVIGYTPKLLFGVWLGESDSTKTLKREDTLLLRNAAAGLWHAAAQYASENQPSEDFLIPSGISTKQVCDPSGLLPTAACPNVVEEVFLEGKEPVKIDTLYRLASINKNTGRLATVFTPPDQVEQKTYLSVPAEAEQWIKSNGFDSRPETFDPFPNITSPSDKSQISSPSQFQFISGTVPIIGIASSKEFAFYRIQYGPGLNPDAWYLLGEDNQTPVLHGLLKNWDTADLDGLFALQLLVVNKDRSVERSTVLVTIDNQPPQVEILYPGDGEKVKQNVRNKIVLQTDISDNLGLDKVSFLIDGEVFAQLNHPPYAISWPLSIGEHLLQVTAWDKAGNNTETIVKFQVE